YQLLAADSRFGSLDLVAIVNTLCAQRNLPMIKVKWQELQTIENVLLKANSVLAFLQSYNRNIADAELLQPNQSQQYKQTTRFNPSAYVPRASRRLAKLDMQVNHL